MEERKFQLGKATVTVSQEMAGLADVVLPLFDDLGGGHPIDDPTRDRLAAMADEILLRIITASSYLAERGIYFEDATYKGNLEKIPFDAWASELSAALENPILGIESKRPSIALESIREISATRVIDSGISLLQGLRSQRNEGYSSIENLLCAMRVFSVFEVASMTLNFPLIGERAVSDTQGKRRSGYGANNERMVKTTAEGLLQGAAYRHTGIKRAGSININSLAGAVAKAIVLGETAIKGHLRALIAAGKIK